MYRNMSRRSYNSLASSRRTSAYRVTDDEVFGYALRAAFLSYLMSPKPVSKIKEEPEQREREHTSTRISEAISHSFYSIGDLFKDVGVGGSSKSVKFPKELVKVLEQKLASIAMGRDAAYSDQLIRRTFAAFYGTSTTDQFRRQMKENRKIEELILLFATCATNILRRDASLQHGDAWKMELNKHIVVFVKMLGECLRTISHVSSELTARLDMYAAKLSPSPMSSSGDSGYETASSASAARARGESVSGTMTGAGLSMSVVDMTMAKVVASLFRVDLKDVQSEIHQIKHFCTERAALQDLKTCLKNITAGEPFPGRPEDFDDEEAWEHWKHMETAHLSQLMLILCQFNPELTKSMPSEALPPVPSARPGSMYSTGRSSPPSSSRHASISSRRSVALVPSSGTTVYESQLDLVNEQIENDSEVPTGHNFTFIPPQPRKFYKRLLELCIQADLEAMANLPEDQEVSLGILSARHLDLLNECALRWRIGHSYRVTCFLDVIKYKYEREEVPMECIPEGLQMIGKAIHDLELKKWPRQDMDYLAEVYGGLFRTFVGSVYHILEGLPSLRVTELAPYLRVLDDIQDSGLLARFESEIREIAESLRERVREVAARAYHTKAEGLFSAPGVNRALPLLELTDAVEGWAKLLDKRFSDPLIGTVDLVALFAEVQIPLFLADLEENRKRLHESSTNGPTPDVPIQDVFALFRRTKAMLKMHEAFCPQIPLQFDMVSFFEPFVRQWLASVSEKMVQWVDAAIDADKFEAVEGGYSSSSIGDVFDSLRTPIDILKSLEWVDEYQEARFFTALSKTISSAMEKYFRKVEDLFMAEMYPRPTEYLQPQKSSAWLERARQLAALTGEKKVVPFNFEPTSCVKLNNIDAARTLLDNMYAQIDVDKMAATLERTAPPVPEKNERPRFLFTVKVVMAEGLVPPDSSSSSGLDTFVTLSDESGFRHAKTRTVYETLDPRWEESFDISVDKALWLMISVRDRALVGKHDTVGRAYLCLDPKRFADLLTHDLWFDLDNGGRILVRVGMEGEKDDIQFYFGRAFRAVKRAEGDMVKIFIDKMSLFIKQSLSRAVIKTLIKGTGTGGLDYNKALDNVTALYRSTIGSSSNEVQIPLPQSERPRVKPEQLTDVEIEQAITPLFDYFESNVQILHTYLCDSAREMVMNRLWKEILLTIEGLLIPPLAHTPSDMTPLFDKEVDIVFKWMKFLRDYFYADGEGLSLELLQNQKCRDVMSIRFYYDNSTDTLMEECVRAMQQMLRSSPTIKKRTKSVYQHRNLGTIKEKKKEKREKKENTDAETIMRILRMRPGTSEFIAQQMEIIQQMQVEQERRAHELGARRLQRPKSRIGPEIPPVPALPS